LQLSWLAILRANTAEHDSPDGFCSGVIFSLVLSSASLLLFLPLREIFLPEQKDTEESYVTLVPEKILAELKKLD